MLDLLREWAAHGVLGYVAVAIAAATPWLEILLVIPPAVLLDLDPALVGVTAFVGNYLPVFGIAVAWDSLSRWSERRRGRPLGASGNRSARGQRILARYGVPGLAILGPLLTGIHLATVLALATGAPRRSVLAWTGASLAAWTVGLVLATMAGLAATG